MKKEIIIGLIIALAVWLGTGAWLVGAADEAEADVTSGDYLCAQHVIDEAGPLMDSYEQFLDEYFKINVPSSDQAAEAMEFYRFVRDGVENLFAEGSEITRKSFGESYDEFRYCAIVRDNYIDYAGIILQEYVLQSAVSKRTFMVVDGLKEINSGLRDFSDNFFSTFPTIFKKMDNALPCYAKQCVSK